MSSRIVKFVRFLLAGIPGFGVSFATNYVLVEFAEFGKLSAYGLALVGQLFVNYLICRYFVFAVDARQSPFWASFWGFVAGSLVLRIADWLLYGVWIQCGLYFLIAQAVNVLLFAVFRFRYAEWLFGKRTGVAVG
jgi:putative flippase GtrA